MQREVNFGLGFFESGIFARGDLFTGRYNDEIRSAFIPGRDDLDRRGDGIFRSLVLDLVE